MDQGVYSVDTWGPRVGAGATDPQYCTLHGVAKVLSPGVATYMVANEFVCARIAALLGLPVPPGVAIDAGGQIGYVALRFGNLNERPPPVIPDHLAADEPEFCAGVLTLDCWVANGDRHAENLAYTRGGAWSPMAFDHSHAFFGEPGDPANLQDFGRSVGAGLLAAHITDPTLFDEWILRAQSIREGVIDEITGALEARSILTGVEATLARDFLVARQPTLPDLLRASLPGVQWR